MVVAVPPQKASQLAIREPANKQNINNISIKFQFKIFEIFSPNLNRHRLITTVDSDDYLIVYTIHINYGRTGRRDSICVVRMVASRCN